MSENIATYNEFIHNYGSVDGAVSAYLENMAQNDPLETPTPENMAYMHNISLSWARRLWSAYVECAQITLRKRVDYVRLSRA